MLKDFTLVAGIYLPNGRPVAPARNQPTATASANPVEGADVAMDVAVPTSPTTPQSSTSLGMGSSDGMSLVAGTAAVRMASGTMGGESPTFTAREMFDCASTDATLTTKTIILTGLFARNVSEDIVLRDITTALATIGLPVSASAIDCRTIRALADHGGISTLAVTLPTAAAFTRLPRCPEQHPLLAMSRQLAPTSTLRRPEHYVICATPTSISAAAFNHSRYVGVLRGAVPDGNFIPVQIQLLHHTLFRDDPDIIIIPQVAGTKVPTDSLTVNPVRRSEFVLQIRYTGKAGIDTVHARYGLQGHIFDNGPFRYQFCHNLAQVTERTLLRELTTWPTSIGVRCLDRTWSLDAARAVLLAPDVLSADIQGAITTMVNTAHSHIVMPYPVTVNDRDRMRLPYDQEVLYLVGRSSAAPPLATLR